MILIDTQILIWWTAGGRDLWPAHRRLLDESEQDGIAASAISVWEVALLVSKNRLDLGRPVQDWLDRISSIPTLHILPATPQILLDSTSLPGTFHPDPADRIIVATARAYDLLLATTDHKILDYTHVRSSGPEA